MSKKNPQPLESAHFPDTLLTQPTAAALAGRSRARATANSAGKRQASSLQSASQRAHNLSDVLRMHMAYNAESLRLASLGYQRESVREMVAQWCARNYPGDPRARLLMLRAMYHYKGEFADCGLAQEAVLMGLAGPLSVTYVSAVFNGAEASRAALRGFGEDRDHLANALTAIGVDRITDADAGALAMLLALGHAAWFGRSLAELAPPLDLAVADWRERWPALAASVAAEAAQ